MPTSVLYVCESRLTEQTRKVEMLYVDALKALLGVRETQVQNVVLLETGIPSLKELIRKKTAKFVGKKFTGDVDEDTPLFKIYKLCEQTCTNGFKVKQKTLEDSNDDNTSILKQTITNEIGTKAVTYREINPKLNVHEVYTTESYIEERKRSA